jgi:hypothetical protein
MEFGAVASIDRKGLLLGCNLEFRADQCTYNPVSTSTAEIVRVCEALPEDKRLEVMDFALSLLDRTEHPDDLGWEKTLAKGSRLPKLEAFLQESAAEGGDEPLDVERM